MQADHEAPSGDDASSAEFAGGSEEDDEATLEEEEVCCATHFVTRLLCLALLQPCFVLAVVQSQLGL